MPGLQTRTIQPHQFIPNSGGRVLTSGTRGTSEPARRLDQLYGEYIHACKIPFHEVGKKDKGVLGRSQPEILYVLFRSYMCFFDQEIFLFLGVKTGGHDQLHDRRKLLLFLLLFWFLEVDIHSKSALRDRGK